MKRIVIICCLLCACAGLYAQGIGSAKDLVAFIEAFNKGESIQPWTDQDNVVFLSADIDLSKTKKLPQVIRFEGIFERAMPSRAGRRRGDCSVKWSVKRRCAIW